VAERKAVKYSNKLIALHRVDSERLFQIYKRKADFCVPVCIVDTSISDEVLYSTDVRQKKPFIVGFIGTAFYANIDAAEYISQKIAPAFSNDSQVQFVIAGNRFESYATKLGKPNVAMSGFVESLDDFYRNVDVILSPISIGGGMKVKVAEALKYNKKIIASSFTLIGYEQSLDCPDIISCSTLDDYVVAIKKLCNTRFKASSSRTYFQKYYSDQACTEYFKNIFNS